MFVLNFIMLVKGVGIILWVYKGSGDFYVNLFLDVDWLCLVKVKDLMFGELIVEFYDDSYFDDEDVDWIVIGQGQKFVGDISFMLVWMFGEQGQQVLLVWFNEGDICVYKICFLNGMVDVFCGWVSSIGKVVMVKEVIICMVKVINVGCLLMVEDCSMVIVVIGMIVMFVSILVVKGQSIMLIVVFQLEGVIDKSFCVVFVDKIKVIVLVSGMIIIVNGVVVGKVNILVVFGNGEFVVVVEIIVIVS